MKCIRFKVLKCVFVLFIFQMHFSGHEHSAARTFILKSFKSHCIGCALLTVLDVLVNSELEEQAI